MTRLLELSDDLLVEEAGKMGVLIALLDNLRQDGHRCLVFSQSRKMLDIIQKVLQNRVCSPSHFFVLLFLTHSLNIHSACDLVVIV